LSDCGETVLCAVLFSGSGSGSGSGGGSSSSSSRGGYKHSIIRIKNGSSSGDGGGGSGSGSSFNLLSRACETNSRNLSPFMELENSLICLKGPLLTKKSVTVTVYFLKLHFSIIPSASTQIVIFLQI
jgi:hypothetical protein